MGIANFCDQTTRFLVEPMYLKLSSKTQRDVCLSIMICALAILIGISIHILAKVVSQQWRKLRHNEETNETQIAVSRQIISVFEEFSEDLKEERNDIEDESPHAEPVQPFPPTDENAHVIPEKNDGPSNLVVNEPSSGEPSEVIKEKKNDVGEVTLHAEPPQLFPSGDLMILRAALNLKKRIYVNLSESEHYVLWYTPESCKIQIQDLDNYTRAHGDDKLEISINEEGKITSLQFGMEQTPCSETISKKFFDCMVRAFEMIDQGISTYTQSNWPYSSRVDVSVVRRNLKRYPLFHLKEFSKNIENACKTNVFVNLKVVFLEDDLNLCCAHDAGGLSRDFLCDLMEGIIQNKGLCFTAIGKSSLVLPQLPNGDKSSNALPIGEEQRSAYQNIGKLMMFSYQSRSSKYVLGRNFDEAIFAAALCLTAEEIDISFTKLNLETKVKMCQALLKVRKDAGMDLTYLEKRVGWLADFDQLDNDQFLEAVLSVYHAEFLPEEFTLNNQGEDPDLDKINQNREKFKVFLIDSIFSQKGAHGQFGAQLAPIHSIAQGMKSVCRPDAVQTMPKMTTANVHWDTAIRALSYQTMSDKVQGSLDRVEIASRIKAIYLDHDQKIEIEKKIGWLQEWIRDEKNGASESELKSLLKYLTGSSTLPNKEEIRVVPQRNQPFCPVPIVHTCNFTMELAPVASQYGSYHDRDKHNFIKTLKEIALNGPSGYQMS